MKNLSIVIGTYLSILRDVEVWYPSMVKEIERHRNRLISIKDARGIGFFTLTLPACANWLHNQLDQGYLDDDRPPYHGRRSKKDVRPPFLAGLYDVIFDEHGTLLESPDPTAIALLRQVYLFAKKYDMQCSQERIDETIADFIACEEELPRSHPGTWDDDHPKWVQRHGHPLWGKPSDLPGLFKSPESPEQFDWDLFRRLCRWNTSLFIPFDHWALTPKHGPGVVSDGPTMKWEFHNWPKKLGRVFPPDWFASHDFVDRTLTDREFPSRLACVPKTQKGPRLIASEPTAHQWMQGAIQRWFEDALKKHPLGLSIDFGNQAFSMEMAQHASAHRDLATVDLSAASDRLSTRLVEYVFQGHEPLLDALHATRSRALVIPPGISSRITERKMMILRKFAPMGSACTFPVQTIVFTLLAHFAVMVARSDRDISWNGMMNRARQIRVFGDDIIIPTDSYPVLERIVTSVGLRINRSKSFAKGFFRESCGRDAYGGYDVTPAYLRSRYDARNPESLASTVECSNNFYKKGLWHTADYLLKTIAPEERKLLPVSNRDLGSCSIFSVQGTTMRHLRSRYNRDLHREEFQILDLDTKSKRRSGTGEASLLQYYTVAPPAHLMVRWTHGEAERPSPRKRRRWVTL